MLRVMAAGSYNLSDDQVADLVGHTDVCDLFSHSNAYYPYPAVPVLQPPPFFISGHGHNCEITSPPKHKKSSGLGEGDPFKFSIS